MDQSVLDAIERWPNVPAVVGWLSLSRRGEWRLHPGGTANEGGFGESIQNQQILSFMNRNYASDKKGQWFFQNGPQRVYVRLDAAPYIVSVTGQPSGLRTHNGLDVHHVKRWVIDTSGNLFLECEHGPACIIDQDLELVVNSLQTTDSTPLLDCWEQHNGHQNTVSVHVKPKAPFILPDNAPLEFLKENDSIDRTLGFVQHPSANSI